VSVLCYLILSVILAQSFLRPGGVSIPVSYTSWLAPLAGAKLWNEARHSKSLETTLKVHLKGDDEEAVELVSDKNRRK